MSKMKLMKQLSFDNEMVRCFQIILNAREFRKIKKKNAGLISYDNLTNSRLNKE